MGALINDGGIPYGSRILRITGSGAGNYVAENVSVTRTIEVIERYNEVGEPAAQVIIPRWVTGTATVQLTTASVMPGQGATFAETFSGSIETFIVGEVTQPYGQTDDTVVNLNFRKKIN